MAFASPTTPLPSIHRDPTALKFAEADFELTLRIIEQILLQIPGHIIKGLADALLNALGLGAFVGDLHAIENNIGAVLTTVWQNLSGLWGAAVTDLHNPMNILAVIIKWINTVFAQANASAQSALSGVVSPIVNNLDGTATDIIGFINHLDGTGTFTGNPASNPLLALVDNLDGTANSVGGFINNLVNSVGNGTHTFAVGGWQQFTQGIGTPNIAQSVNAIMGLTTPLINNLDGTATAISSSVSNIVNNLDGTATQILSDAGSVVNSLFGGVAQLINNFDGTAATPAQSVANSANAVATHAAILAAMQAKIATPPAVPGLNVTVNFSSYANSLNLPNPPFSTATYAYAGGATGNYGVTSGLAKWSGLTTGIADVPILYNAAQTVSDFQLISCTFNGGASTPAQFNIHGRCNTAHTQYIFALLYPGNSYAELGYNAGSGEVLLAQLNGTFTFDPTGTYTLACGTASSVHAIQLLHNGVSILSSADTGSSFGSSNRLAGLLPVSSATSNTPPLVSFSFADNAPPPPTGSGFRQFRASTSGVTVAGGLMPNNFFDTNQYITSDYAYAPNTNNQLTVSVAGWYMVVVSVNVGGTSIFFQPGLYHNGSLAQSGCSFSDNNTFSDPWSTSYIIYCASGDTLQPGWAASSGGVTAVGDAAGIGTYWSVAFMNCGTLS